MRIKSKILIAKNIFSKVHIMKPNDTKQPYYNETLSPLKIYLVIVLNTSVLKKKSIQNLKF